jgi:putative sterol carrier protein
MNIEDIISAIKSKVGENSGIDASVKFVIDGDKFIHIDGKQVPNVVSTEDKDADCTVKITTENISKILDGSLSAMSAFMAGKIKVEGNMGVAMNINKIL